MVSHGCSFVHKNYLGPQLGQSDTEEDYSFRFKPTKKGQALCAGVYSGFDTHVPQQTTLVQSPAPAHDELPMNADTGREQ